MNLPGTMDFSDIIVLIAGILVVISAVYQIATGKIALDKNDESQKQYTPESLNIANRLMGIFIFFAGACLVIYKLVDTEIISAGFPKWILLIGVGVFAGISIVAYFVTAKKIPPDFSAAGYRIDKKQ